MSTCPIECVNIVCNPSWLEKHESFVLTIVGLAGTGIGVLLSYCLNSRCKNIKAGCISCDRDVLPPDNLVGDVEATSNTA